MRNCSMAPLNFKFYVVQDDTKEKFAVTPEQIEIKSQVYHCHSCHLKEDQRVIRILIYGHLGLQIIRFIAVSLFVFLEIPLFSRVTFLDLTVDYVPTCHLSYESEVHVRA